MWIIGNLGHRDPDGEGKCTFTQPVRISIFEWAARIDSWLHPVASNTVLLKNSTVKPLEKEFKLTKKLARVIKKLWCDKS